MKVTAKQRVNTIPFANLLRGEVFYYNTSLWMRIESLASVGENAITLSSGTAARFLPTDLVIRVSGTFVED